MLARQCLYPWRQNTASGPEHPSQPSENPPPSLGPGILTDTPDPDPDLASLPLPKTTSSITREGVGLSHYHIVTFHRVVSFRFYRCVGVDYTGKVSISDHDPKHMFVWFYIFLSVVAPTPVVSHCSPLLKSLTPISTLVFCPHLTSLLFGILQTPLLCKNKVFFSPSNLCFLLFSDLIKTQLVGKRLSGNSFPQTWILTFDESSKIQKLANK